MEREDVRAGGSSQARLSRHGFLGKLGKTLAVGLGVMAAPAAAFARTETNSWCCHAPPDCQLSCPPGEYSWKCTDCSGVQCCYCLSVTPSPPGECRRVGCDVC